MADRIAWLEKQIKEIPAVSGILDRLRNELSPSLTYHSLSHTEDVIHECCLFAVTDNIHEKDILHLGIAAAFHDSGFLVRNENNEEIGAKFARDALSKDSLIIPAEVSRITSMIEDTFIDPRISRSIARTELSKYLLDADLSNLGRLDFFEKNELYRIEIGMDKKGFYQRTIDLLEKHRWHTLAAFSLREEQKQRNINLLRTQQSLSLY